MKYRTAFSIALAAIVLTPTVLATPPRIVEDPADADIGPLDILAVWLTSDGQALTVTAVVRDLSQPDPISHGLDYFIYGVHLSRPNTAQPFFNLYAEVYLQETSHQNLPNARYLGTPRETPQIPTAPGTYAWLHMGHNERYYLDDVTVRFEPASSTITWTVPYTMLRQGSVGAPAKVQEQVLRSNEVLVGPVQSQGAFAETGRTFAGLTVDEVVLPADYKFTLK